MNMTLKAYLDNIEAKTGTSAADFKKLAGKKGYLSKEGLRAGIKVGAVVAWLKQDFQLGHGHAMAIVALLKGKQDLGQYWSWEDRGIPTVAAYQGTAEAVNVVAAWRGDSANNLPAKGRRDGQTYSEGWARARKVGPHFALAGSFNEWSNPNEEPSAEISKDIEPSRVFGMQYLELLKKRGNGFQISSSIFHIDPALVDGRSIVQLKLLQEIPILDLRAPHFREVFLGTLCLFASHTF